MGLFLLSFFSSLYFSKTQNVKPINLHKSLNSSSIYIFAGLLFASILIAYGVSKFGLNAGILSILFLSAIPVVLLLVSNFKLGFYFVFVLSFFINYIHRWTDTLVPLLILEVILYVVVIGMLLKELSKPGSTPSFWKYYKTPIAIGLIIWLFYNHLEFLNPNSTIIVGKVIAIRQSWYALIGFTVALLVFDSIKSVKIFFKIMLSLSLLAAIFALSQKYFGLLPYEREWLYSSPLRVRLFVVWGQPRMWSFLNDPTVFGLLMASSGLVCFILMTGPYKFFTRVMLGISGALMFLAMISSGTRTAFVMVLAGFGIFGLINIKNIRTQIISFSALLILIIIYFGPFYSPQVIRFRTAFQGDKDPSMNVRLINKERIRPYLFTHPIGGGPNTSGGTVEESDHPLGGFPPDSGYLKIALEMGYIGLCLILWLYFRASTQLTSQYFQTKDIERKVIYLAILASMISLFTSELTQIAVSQKPLDFIIFSYFAIIVRLQDIK